MLRFDRLPWVVMSCALLAGCGLGFDLGAFTAGPDGAAATDAHMSDAETVDPDASSLDCLTDMDCDDGNPCSGFVRCGEMGTCLAGPPQPDDTPCPTVSLDGGRCRGGICVPLTCPDGMLDPGEECDDGNRVDGDGCDVDCMFSCHTHADCATVPCATSTCDAATHACTPPVAMTCPPGDDCGAYVCNDATGMCDHFEHDSDLDGYPACGGDCFDEDGLVNPGQVMFFAMSYRNAMTMTTWDYNCDSRNELRWPGRFGSCSSTGPTACTGGGWGGATPDCGIEGSWVTCAARSGGGCMTSALPRRQECR